MQISDIIAIFALIVSSVSLVVSWHTSNRHSRLSVFSEYTRRYQDIVLRLYSDPSNKEVYHKLYFDLCSEEYYLRKTTSTRHLEQLGARNEANDGK